MQLIQKKRIEMDEESWYLYRVYAYLVHTQVDVTQLLNGTIRLHLNTLLQQDQFLKFKEGKPASYTLDQLIE